MRTSSAAGLFLLAACSSDASEVPPPDDEDRIECALAGAAAFVRECWIEDGPGGLLVLRHPDGGFRRLEWVEIRGGAVLDTADGSERARVDFRDSTIEVAVGTDRYRLPRALSDERR
jgi:hypothetical protein